MTSGFKYRRVLLKISGEALMGQGSGPFDPSFLEFLASEIAAARQAGLELGIVTGGGNIFRGLSGTGQGVDRITGDYMGMLATLINALGLSSFLKAKQVPCRILAPIPYPQIAEPACAANARRAAGEGLVVLFAGGTGNPFFTTDSGAALRALELGCDALFKATKVDGIYDRDPVRHPEAVFLPRLSYDEALRRQIGVMDQAAFSLCRDHQIPIVVFNIHQPGQLLRAARGEPAGSLVGP